MKLPQFIKTGFSFGLTSGIITTLGLMVGLSSGTQSRLVVIGGILTIAFADAFSDAFGIHISEESENEHTSGEIWKATFITFFTKLIFALTFLVPAVLCSLPVAIYISIGWGLFLLGLLSLILAKQEKTAPWKVMGEHWLIAGVVIAVTHLVGKMVETLF